MKQKIIWVEFCERSGVVNIALEGKLLAAVSGSAWVGLGAGIAISVLFALMHGFATITHRGDQVVSGMAINILAVGLTVTLGRYWFDQGGQAPALSGDARFAPIDFPYAKELYDVPVIGQLYSELLSGHSLLEYVVFGKWRPWNAMAACLLFGFLDAVAIRLQGVTIDDFPIPVQAIEALPYILTVFLLAGFIGRAVAPKALGTPYVKERE
ncbi:ABC transporter permease [Aeromonas jandaei]|uniref:ABC transporter permease n=1 Tax=Aeromonas jandaei TaxID=650 RepID=UPI003BA0AF13